MMDGALNEIKVNVATLLAKQDESHRRLTKIEEKLEDKVVTRDEHHNQDERISALEDTIKWLTRTVVGSLILAGLTALGLGKKVGFL